ncbi:MAG: hypothetical protein IJM38_05410 [Ruminococcus sp.]|nr:hypothetical protein [Ruminococcus sp.]
MLSTRYGNQENAPYIAVIVFIILAFSTIWLPWLNLKATVACTSAKETLDYTELMQADEDYTKYGRRLDSYGSGLSQLASEKEYDTIRNSYNVMRYSALAGFVLLACTLVFVFINKKAMTIASLLSTLAFAASSISGLIYCSKTTDFMNDFIKKTIGSFISIKYEISITYGLFIPVLASLVITMIGFTIKSKPKVQEQTYDADFYY